MSIINKIHSAISIDELRKARGYNFYVLRRSTGKIPAKSGVYVWRYWPSVTSLDKVEILKVIQDIQNNFPGYSEKLSNSRIKVTVEKTAFGESDSDDRMFGIQKNGAKISNLLNLIDESDDVRRAFAHTLEILLSSSPPLYIGKANDLRDRLTKHFENKTEVIKRIEDAGVPLGDIYISYIVDGLSTDENGVTTAIEEILQRITNPPLTKRYG